MITTGKSAIRLSEFISERVIKVFRPVRRKKREMSLEPPQERDKDRRPMDGENFKPEDMPEEFKIEK